MYGAGSPAAKDSEGSAVPGRKDGAGSPRMCRLLACCWPRGWAALLPSLSPSLFPAGLTPGLLCRPQSNCPCKGRGLGSQIPDLDFNERAGGDALAHMLQDARGACRGQEGIFPGCEQRCTIGRLWQGRGQTSLRSSRRCRIWKGAAGLPLCLTWGRRSLEAEREAGQAPSLEPA